MGTISLTLPSDGQTIDASDVNNPLNTLLNEFNGNIDDNNIKSAANISGTKLLVSSMPANKLDSNGQGGWVTGILPAVLSVTENGNRSADITFASTVANILTPGMRIRTTRTVAAPTYMGGAFNGTNHYFTKVTPTSTLSTVTSAWTMMAHVEPTAYAQSVIMGRADNTLANGFILRIEADGRIAAVHFSGGIGNYKVCTSYQSLPLNKKSHVAATYDGAGSYLIYLDGVLIPSATVGVGTNPASAGTGGDFSIGRPGAYNAQYWTGYISGCGVFNAVLSAATIRSYKNQVLSGSETNCIGAWSLNNTGVNQQAAGTNDLTATNSVSYTVRSPYATNANGNAGGSLDYAIVTNVSTTVATVQYPEGCAIPTSGGISAVDYSGVKAPFGMPMQRGRWQIITVFASSLLGAFGAINNWTSLTGYTGTSIPVGSWRLGYQFSAALTSTVAGTRGGYVVLTTATPTNAFYGYDLATRIYSNASASTAIWPIYKDTYVELSSATTYIPYFSIDSASGSETFSINGAQGINYIFADLATL